LLYGDSLDIYNDYIVTGSNRNKDVMQVFSISQQKLVENFDFNQQL